MKRFLGYTRDKKGNVTKRRVQEVANTVHTFTGGVDNGLLRNRDRAIC